MEHLSSATYSCHPTPLPLRPSLVQPIRGDEVVMAVVVVEDEDEDVVVVVVVSRAAGGALDEAQHQPKHETCTADPPPLDRPWRTPKKESTAVWLHHACYTTPANSKDL